MMHSTTALVLSTHAALKFSFYNDLRKLGPLYILDLQRYRAHI